MDHIICLDTNLPGHKNSIAAFLIPHADGAALVDVGAGSTTGNLSAALAEHGFTPRQVTHVFLTHIHLDHAGAAGWFARYGAQVYVHPVGAPHMLNPEKLIASARRIYGDEMDTLWGEFLPVPAANLTEVRDGDEIAFGGRRITALHTPGHAEHHVCYLFQDACFTGDIGGVRKPGPAYVRLPFVPPETHFGKWRDSLERIRATGCKWLALSHFDLYDDAPGHLALARRFLDDVEQWLEAVMPETPDVETLYRRYGTWLDERAQAQGLDELAQKAYEFLGPAQMGASGLFRYWHKVRAPSQPPPNPT